MLYKNHKSTLAHLFVLLNEAEEYYAQSNKNYSIGMRSVKKLFAECSWFLRNKNVKHSASCSKVR